MCVGAGASRNIEVGITAASLGDLGGLRDYSVPRGTYSEWSGSSDLAMAAGGIRCGTA